MKRNLLGSVIIFMLLIFLWVNANFFWTGNVQIVKDILLLYLFLFVFVLVVFKLEAPTLFDTPFDFIFFTGIFLVSSAVFLTLPTIPATIVGSISSVATALSSVGFIQSFLASFIETIVFIWAIYKVVTNKMLRFIVSNLVFISFHVSVVFTQYISITQGLLSLMALFILNSIFQVAYIFGDRKGSGIESATAIHWSWDLGVFHILPLLFKGIISGG